METPPKRPRGGRPKSDPVTVRDCRVNARLTQAEYATLCAKAEHMHMTPAQWLRESALTRRLPPPPVPAINREEYASLARLSANLNQLTKSANEGKSVVIHADLLRKLIEETKRLRLALLGISHDRQSN